MTQFIKPALPILGMLLAAVALLALAGCAPASGSEEAASSGFQEAPASGSEEAASSDSEAPPATTQPPAAKAKPEVASKTATPNPGDAAPAGIETATFALG